MPKHSLIFVAVALAGCASLAPAVAERCLPLGVSIEGAITLAMEPVVIERDGGGADVAVRVMGSIAGHPVMMIWLGRMLLAVDADPMNTNSPVWVDQGFMTTAGRLRSEFGTPCQWYQPTPTPKEEKV